MKVFKMAKKGKAHHGMELVLPRFVDSISNVLRSGLKSNEH